MKWITGYTQAEALALDTQLLNAARSKLNTFAETWGAFKHPTTNEWCVPWDEERAAMVQLVEDQVTFLNTKVNQGVFKTYQDMINGQWVVVVAEPVIEQPIIIP